MSLYTKHNDVCTILFKIAYKKIVGQVRKCCSAVSSDFLIKCLTSSSVFTNFEHLSAPIFTIVNSAVLKSGLTKITDENVNDILVFIKSKYPIYVRWIDTLILHFCDNIGRLHKALQEDESAIKDTFHIENPLNLSSVQFNLGDSHRGGKTVMMLEYSDGKKLIYKPRNLSIDKHFAQLLSFVQDTTGLSFKMPKTIAAKDHGWVEFIEYRECESITDVKEYYYRIGGLLAILYSLNATDFHYENIISCGSFPVLIDLESFFVPYILIEAAETSITLLESVLGTGMLPTIVILDKEEKPDKRDPLVISGVVDVEGQESITEETSIQLDDNGDISVTRARGKLKGANNVPTYKSKKIRAEDYSSDIVQGFERIYSFIMDNKQAYIDKLEMFRNDTVRIILRDTAAYAHLLREANNVNILKDESNLKALFSKWLGEAVPDFTFLDRVVPYEIEDLTNLDIPLFTTRVDSCNLWHSDDSCIENCFEESGYSRVLRKIAKMDSNDCAKQKWLIEASLNYERKSMMDDHDAAILPNDSSNTTSIGDRLETVASSVFRYITDHIQETEESVSWLTVHAGNYSNSRIQIFDSSYDLFTGMPGEILFMASYDKVFGSSLGKHLALKAYSSLSDTIESMRGSISLLGLYKGWGSILFLNTSLFQLTGDEKYLRVNEKYFDEIDFCPLIESDKSYGIIKGCAGFILSCMDYYNVSRCRKSLATAVKAGDYLLSNACPEVKVGMGWRIASRHPLSGYSHGSSGFALAFLRLYEQTDDIRYLNAVSGIIDYEDSTYDDGYRNWKDLRDHIIREKDEPPFLAAWSHGAGGIGLTRLEMLKSGLFDSDSRIKRDLDIALETTLSQGFTSNFSLTVGSCGNIELLLNYLEQYDDQSLRTRYHSILNSICKLYAEDDYHICFPIKSLGLMAGMTGIGYECLRLLRPDIVRSVLVL